MDTNLNWNEAIARLKEGNRHFVNDMLEGKLQNSSRREELVSGQNPYAIILTCSDSRTIPEYTFDTGLGELFVIRVAGNIANTSTIASIEYAVAHIGVNLVVVLGHDNCGAIAAAIEGGDGGKNINHLLSHIMPVLNSVEDKSVNNVARENTKYVVEQIVNNSEIVKNAVNKESFKILPAYYYLQSGKVDFFEYFRR